MGLFSSKKKIYVSSVVYNLAGDEKDRPHYLKSTIVGGVFAEVPSLTDHLHESYMKGPGIRLRSFARWSRQSDFGNQIGLVTGSIVGGNKINNTVLAAQIPVAAGKTVMIQSSEMGVAEFSFWADQHVAQYYPERLDSAYESDFFEDSNTIRIRFPDGMVTSFIPAGFDPHKRYIYAIYNEADGQTVGPLVPGVPVILDPSESYPPTSGWDEQSYSAVPTPQDLDTITIVDVTYSDNRPPEHSETTTTTTETYTLIQGEWTKITRQGGAGNAIVDKAEFMYQHQTATVEVEETTDTQTETIAGGVIKTTVTVVKKEVLKLERGYRIDSQTTTLQSWGPTIIFIYGKDTGNPTLDAMFNATGSVGSFYPFIPFRIDGDYVSELWPTTLYPACKRAVTRAIGGKYDKIEKSISENDKIDDINYTYAVFGVSLNVKENACKKYIFKFFELIANDPNLTTQVDYATFKAQWAAAEQSAKDWDRWRLDNMTEFPPYPPVPEPVRLPYPTVPGNSLRVRSANNSAMNYDMTISWNYIDQTNGSGLGFSGAKMGDLHIVKAGSDRFQQWGWYEDDYGYRMERTRDFYFDKIDIIWQTGTNSWKKITAMGLYHKNLVYKGKAVDISGDEALEDEDESGFIIPLHESVYREMGLKDSTQMSTACTFLVFNCYKVVKQKWYQSGIFKVFIVVVAIVVTIYSGGAGAGLLGTAASVGASLGFAGTMAILVGGIANALAAMILMTIIQKGATMLLGDKMGAIVGAIAGFVAVQVGTSMMAGGGMAGAFGNMMKAQNLLMLTNSVSGGISNYMQASAMEYQVKTQALMEQYNAESKAIQQAWEQNLGTANSGIDPMQFTDIFSQYVEPMDSFLQRTLMTGSDIARMSMDMIGSFAESTTSQQLV